MLDRQGKKRTEETIGSRKNATPGIPALKRGSPKKWGMKVEIAEGRERSDERRRIQDALLASREKKTLKEKKRVKRGRGRK